MNGKNLDVMINNTKIKINGMVALIPSLEEI